VAFLAAEQAIVCYLQVDLLLYRLLVQTLSKNATCICSSFFKRKFEIIGNISSVSFQEELTQILKSATGYSQSPTGGAVLSIDNLTITTGILNMNLTSAVSIKGNISVATGQTLTLVLQLYWIFNI
jgi:hypothetical protein